MLASLHLQVLSVVMFNGLNFLDWCEQVSFHLNVLNLDLTLLIEKPFAIIDSYSDEHRSFHKAWERSNRLNLMFMQMTTTTNIKFIIPKTKSTKEYMKFVEERSQLDFSDMSLFCILMGTLTTIKFDGSCTMHQHVIEMINIVTKLRPMGLEVSESFLVQFIINSLPLEYGPFQINYNTIKDK